MEVKEDTKSCLSDRVNNLPTFPFKGYDLKKPSRGYRETRLIEFNIWRLIIRINWGCVNTKRQ